MREYQGYLLCAAIVGTGSPMASAGELIQGGTVVFVDDDASSGGDGLSWDTAFKDLQDALDYARGNSEVREVWVAQGVYWPDRGGGDRTDHFSQPDGLRVFGGFAGDETTRDQRDWILNVTVLSGDLAQNDLPNFQNREDNSFKIHGGTTVGGQGRLDGFVIEGGNASESNNIRGRGSGITALDCGSFIVANSTIRDCYARSNGAGAWVSGNVTFEDCTFLGNECNGSAGALFCETANSAVRCLGSTFDSNTSVVSSGGAIDFLNGSLVVSDCAFVANRAMSNDGGAIFLAFADLDVRRTDFIGNTGSQGGAIFSGPTSRVLLRESSFSRNHGVGGAVSSNFPENTVDVIQCVFNENTSNIDGGAIHAWGQLTVSDCVFGRNSAGARGGAVRLYRFGGSLIQGCSFDGNQAELSGGAIAAREAGSLRVEVCSFDENTSGQEGGGIHTISGPIELVDCMFTRNSGSVNGGTGGGAVYMSTNSPSLATGCTFESNTSGRQGGAVAVRSAGCTWIDCYFSANWSQDGGGGVLASATSTNWLKCIFINNSSARSGGGMYVGGNGQFLNCRFLGNSSMQSGGGCYDFTIGSSFLNCEFSGNTSEGSGAGLAKSASTTTVVNSTFSQNAASNRGGGIASLGDGDFRVVNTILWGNSDSGSEEETAQIHIVQGGLLIDYSCVHGWTGGFGGIGNVGFDPLFIEPVGGDGIPGTVDDDLAIGVGSPCIDAGSNPAVPADIFDLDSDGDVQEATPIDLRGRNRFRDDPASADTGTPGNGHDEVVDMGSLEFQPKNGVAELVNVSVTTGVILGGTVGELLASDDEYVHTRSGFGQTFIDLHNMTMVVSATTAVQNPTSIDLSVETRISNPTGTMQIRLKNWNTGTFELVGTRAINGSDRVYTVDGINAMLYVEPGSGNIDLQLKQIVHVPFLAFQFESFIDWVEIAVE